MNLLAAGVSRRIILEAEVRAGSRRLLRFRSGTDAPGGPALFPAVLCALLFSGCAGYHLGPTNGLRAGERSVQIEPFVNQTIEPRLTDALTSSLRKNLQKDGTFRLNTKNEGDIIVSGAIVHYDRIQLSFQPTDVLTPRQYRIVLTAQVTARERVGGKAVLNRRVTGQSTLFVGTDLSSSERQALPLAADDLARTITGLLVDGEW